MRVSLLGLLTLLVVSCLQTQAQTSPGSTRQPDSVDAFLRHQMQLRRIPGLQLAVVRHGKIVKLGAYGLANIQDAVPVTNRTVFSIASITKAFVGVAIMQLVEEGKLDLAAPVSRYLDGLPTAWQPVTIRQLLIHTSGIPNIFDGRMVVEGNAEAAWAKVQTMPMEFAPGERFSYNQTNYVLLGKIIDKLSGQPFVQFIKERQFDRVGMPHTSFDEFSDVVPNRTLLYTYFQHVNGKTVFGDKLKYAFYESAPFLLAGNGINTTAEDLARWVIALQQGKLFQSNTSLTTLWTPGALNNGSPGGFNDLLNGYAIGWRTITRPEHHAVGGTGGGETAFFVYPDDDLTVVILTNLQGANPELFIDEVAGYYIPGMSVTAGFGLPPAIKTLHTQLMKRGFDHATELIDAAKQQDAAFQLPEVDVNAWGYRLLEHGQTKAAIEIFKLNVRLYPESANTYDSLGEAYEAANNKALAIRNYRRSLELNPQNTNAVDHLKKLEPNETTSGTN